MFDLTVAIEVGIVLAAFLFMHRMSEVVAIGIERLAARGGPRRLRACRIEPDQRAQLPPGVEAFQISGPLFFAVANRLDDVLDQLPKPPRVFILRMRLVPLIDASGVAGAVSDDRALPARRARSVILSGLREQPRRILAQMGVDEDGDGAALRARFRRSAVGWPQAMLGERDSGRSRALCRFAPRSAIIRARAAQPSFPMSDFIHRLPEFLGNHLYLTLGFIAVLIALLVTEMQRFTRGYKALTPAGLTQLVNRENALLIDVSSLQDFEKGHVPGARHVAMSQFDPENKDLAKAKELPVAIYDRNGQASGRPRSGSSRPASAASTGSKAALRPGPRRSCRWRKAEADPRGFWRRAAERRRGFRC